MSVMQNQHIVLNFKHAKMMYKGIDSVYLPKQVPKLVVFIDSMSCSGCFMNSLLRYYEVNDSLIRRNASMLVILHPPKTRIEELKKRLDIERYPFWCILDKEGEFIKNNPNFTDNKLLHTFALDKNDNVILVGDPSTNPKIKQLLFNTIKQSQL